MHACLFDPAHGYYATQRAIGASGDFVTAPEISQAFGELLGLWVAVAWQQMGSPAAFDLVEYGPGHGTMMADGLRALAKAPACLAAASVRLVEVSPALREIQRERLGDVRVAISWHTALSGECEPQCAIVLANEVLDAQPVEQLIAIDGQIGVRCVMADAGGRLQFCTRMPDGALRPDRPDGVIERRILHPIVARDLAALPAFAGLFVDYGHTRSTTGDTLQAVRAHRFEHPLCSPGEADLTAHVDFELFGGQCGSAGLAIDGPVSQGELLSALGIVERAEALMSANPSRANEIEAGIARLLSPTGMGTRFKAIGVRSSHLPPLPGFPTAAPRRE